MIALNKQHVLSFKSAILQAKNIVILSHINPDGDAVGSILALQNTLKSINVSAVTLLPNQPPTFLNFLAGAEDILTYTQKPAVCQQAIETADLLICIDFNDLKRLGTELPIYCEQSKATKVLIDHHPTPNVDSFDMVFSETQISSSCELLYWLLHTFFETDFLNKDIAECLYTGICTDTGSFSYSSNYPSTYAAVQKFIEKGIDTEDLHNKIYNASTEQRMRLLGHCLCNRMIVNEELGTAYIYLPKEDLIQFNYQDGDTEGVVNYTLGMNNIHVGAMLTESKDKIRMSFRSKDNFDVNLFARTYFNGGGHKKAAGGSSFDDIKTTIQKLEEAFAKELKK